ncbi:MAG: hypothetical protein AABY84_02915 [Candidatus Firestonebacteria bacterium]
MNRSLIAWTILISVFILFYVWQRVEIVKMGYQIDKLQEESTALINKNKSFQLEIVRLKSFDRVETLVKEMGLMPPKKFESIEFENPEIN